MSVTVNEKDGNKLELAKWNKIYIGGEWREGSSDRVYTQVNPYTQESIAEIRFASKEDVDAAYASAKKVQKEWVKVPAIEKVKIIENAIAVIEKRQNEFVHILITEGGGTHFKSQLELLGLAAGYMKEAATYPLRMGGEVVPSIIPGKTNNLYRNPLGVVGVISPWNFPFHLTMRSVVAALATGNGVVLKPATLTYISGGLIIAEIFEEAGLPKGLLNVVVGAGSEIGDYIVQHPVPRMISFTGSTEVGERIGQIAGGQLKKVALELGGNCAFIVLEDADLNQAASAAVFGKYTHQGQICMAINRILVDRKVYAEFVSIFKEKVTKLKSGNPIDPGTDIGPLIEKRQVDQITNLINGAVAAGAKLELEGIVEGNLMTPYILTDVKNDMEIAQTEIFGPVAVIIPFDTEEEAIALANDTVYGLSSAIYTADKTRGALLAQEIETGMVHINDQTVNDEPHIPFGGEKASGLGRFNGEYALEEFTTVKWISVMDNPRGYPY